MKGDVPDLKCPVCSSTAAFVYRQSMGRHEAIVTAECTEAVCSVTKFKVWLHEDIIAVPQREAALACA